MKVFLTVVDTKLLLQGRSQEETTTEAKDPEISRIKSSDIMSLMKKNKKERQHLVKFYRGECLGSPHTGYGPVLLFPFSDQERTGQGLERAAKIQCFQRIRTNI